MPSKSTARSHDEQRLHDLVAVALAAQYQHLGHATFVNPGPQKRMAARGKYPDVVVMRKRGRSVLHVIEVETRSSVNRTESARQWVEYDELYHRWFLAVPLQSRRTARTLIAEHELQRVELITWSFDFNSLP